MALKRSVTKAEFEALTDALKIEYKADTGGATYTLDVTGLEDTGALTRALDREKQEKKDAKEAHATEKARADDLQSKVDALGPNAAAQLKDIKTLEKSWKEKADAAKLEADGKVTVLTTQIEKLTLNKQASDLALKLGGEKNQALLEPHIRQRLKLENNGTGDPLVRVLDVTGLPSASSLTDLENEFRTSDRYKSVIVANNGSGGGAAGSHQSRQQARGSESSAPIVRNGKPFNQLNGVERTEWYRSDPAGFNQASEANKSALREAARPVQVVS